MTFIQLLGFAKLLKFTRPIIMELMELKYFIKERPIFILITLRRYSMALSGLLKAAFIAARHCSFGNPMLTISSTALLASSPINSPYY